MRWGLLFLMVLAMTQPVHAENPLRKNNYKWQSPHFQNHPLLEGIYSTNGNKVSVDTLKTALSRADYLLLGEIHNNPDHHILQAQLLLEFARMKKLKPSVVFEMVPQRLQSVLDNANADKLDELSQKLEWKKRGWFSWDIYKPIFKAALSENLPLTAGNLELKTTRTISRKGINSLSPERQKQLSLDIQLTAEMTTSLQTELNDSHCGLLPERAMTPMALVQRVRDGAMALAIKQSKSRGAILIAGSGHVRKDRGVPRLLGGLNTLIIGLLEVSPTKPNAASYALKNAQGEALYDYVIFTPKFDITDHCAALRKRFKKKTPTNG